MSQYTRQPRNYSLQTRVSILFFFITVFCAPLFCASVSVPKTYSTIAEALIKVSYGDTILVSPGKYNDDLTVKTGVTLISIERYKAEIVGKGRINCVTLAGENTIIGFSISRGKAGILSRGKNNIIKDCKIFRNRGSGILCMIDLPVIENNLIVHNAAMGIQILDVHVTAGHITHNTIAYNSNTGIMVSAQSTFTIKDNIISSNRTFGIRNKSESIILEIRNNLFYNNRIFGGIPENNITSKPMFVSPRRKLNFTLESDSPAIKKASDNKDLGVIFQ